MRRVARAHFARVTAPPLPEVEPPLKLFTPHTICDSAAVVSWLTSLCLAWEDLLLPVQARRDLTDLPPISGVGGGRKSSDADTEEISRRPESRGSTASDEGGFNEPSPEVVARLRPAEYREPAPPPLTSDHRDTECTKSDPDTLSVQQQASATSATADDLAPEGASQTKKVCLQVIKKRPRKPDVADVHEWCSAATGKLNAPLIVFCNKSHLHVNRNVK
ncbi:hypothetical protein EVAR_53094_1 [Eumeta japonica]|uniref:Uncharacterized protein n=1 Tax=Eumeta variegata TaxID=151549 RepID=A0A4C1ZIE8_EUMVA|nr:hypothetical protein EVAR_53094_1 [Eumeta japonica]